MQPNKQKEKRNKKKAGAIISNLPKGGKMIIGAYVVLAAVIYFLLDKFLVQIATFTGITAIATLPWWALAITSLLIAVFIRQIIAFLFNLTRGINTGLGTSVPGGEAAGQAIGGLLGRIYFFLTAIALFFLNLMWAGHFGSGVLTEYANTIDVILLASMFLALIFAPAGWLRGLQVVIFLATLIIVSGRMVIGNIDKTDTTIATLEQGELVLEPYDQPFLKRGHTYHVTVEGESYMRFEMFDDSLNLRPHVAEWQDPMPPAGNTAIVGDWLGYGEERPFGEVAIYVGNTLIPLKGYFDLQGNMDAEFISPANGQFRIGFNTPGGKIPKGITGRLRVKVSEITNTRTAINQERKKLSIKAVSYVSPEIAEGMRRDGWEVFEYLGSASQPDTLGPFPRGSRITVLLASGEKLPEKIYYAILDRVTDETDGPWALPKNAIKLAIDPSEKMVWSKPLNYQWGQIIFYLKNSKSPSRKFLFWIVVDKNSV